MSTDGWRTQRTGAEVEARCSRAVEAGFAAQAHRRESEERRRRQLEAEERFRLLEDVLEDYRQALGPLGNGRRKDLQQVRLLLDRIHARGQVSR
ncbi:hypothetical protein [Conexibacter sp. DBS9H8]|uniref:hypothetical protein n=1 Tax=Conexibacter sp. DBS9H8 TaxID=2937801 RepID=UPI00200DF16B|nr:hypothetical protein [Conexibacter sp. DBS9H8]